MRSIFVVSAIAIWSAAASARANETERVTQSLIDLDHKIHISSLEFREAPPHSAERALVEAEVLLQLKKYDQASALLLEVLEKWPASRAAQDAAFLLAESLFELEDYRASRARFEQALELFAGSRRAQGALERLIQIARRTGDFDFVDAYLDRLLALPRCDPWVPYLKAKNLYFSGKHDQARATFAAIGAASPFHLRARYFIATMTLREGDPTTAMTAFEAIAGLPPRNDGEREIRDFARLALGRLWYERREFTRAVAVYRSIPGQPQRFPDALYETGWSLVKLNQFQQARDTFARFLEAQPHSPYAPELKVLMGNLHVRLGKFAQAKDEFSHTLTELGPVLDRVRSVLDHGVVVSGMLESLASDDGRDRLAALLSPKAAHWVRGAPEVIRLSKVQRDLAEIRVVTDGVVNLVAELDAVLGRENKVNIFADFLEARALSQKMLREIDGIRRQFGGAVVPARVSRQARDGVIDVLSRADAVEQQIRTFDQRVGGEAERRAQVTRMRIDDERRHVENAMVDLATIDADLRNVAPVLLARGVTRVESRLSDLVVGADAGLLDVAWGHKEEKRLAVQALITQRQRDVDALNKELKRKLARFAPPAAR